MRGGKEGAGGEGRIAQHIWIQNKQIFVLIQWNASFGETTASQLEGI